ncbi:MAG TPA: pyrimidine reductase family protein [Mycobacterium sp.]|jgi:riboflavin biosynthesis pyrimidine reductase
MSVPDDASAQFTRLDSLTSVGPTELARLYAYPPDLTRCWVRANMIVSVDGGATVDGRAGGLAGPGDRMLFNVLREIADVVLVGAGTVRTENYSGAQLGIAARQSRQARGQAEIPPIAVVTASGALDPDSRLFMRSETQPLIFTTNASFGATRDRLVGAAEVVDASTTDPIVVDPTAVLAQLARRGLHRVLCEGGPTLLGDIVALDLLDELALTMAPLLVAGGAPRMVTSRVARASDLRPAHILTDEQGYLYMRYTRTA